MLESCEAVVLHEEAREEARDEAGLESSRLLLLTVRRLRLRPRFISTTSMEGGNTALGMILDM